MEMKKLNTTRSQKPLFMWVLVAVFVLHQNLLLPVVMCSRSFEDQKTYYSPPSTDPHHGGSHKSPGGSCTPTPSTPKVSPPKHSGGGYHYSPPSGGGSPPSTGGSPPIVITPPSVPTDPSITTPPTPFIPQPSPPSPFTGTCDYWRTHPQAIWGIFGWWGTTVGGVFGVLGSTPSLASDISLEKALSNTRTDGIGALYREGTASLLNSMVNRRFPFSTEQVKAFFSKALTSEQAAAAQAQLFKKANEGRLKPRA